MKRREFITMLGNAAAAWPLAARAQEPGRTYRLGGLFPSPREAPQNVAMFEELRRSGFIEGQNLTIDWHEYGQRVELVSKFAAELVKARVDVIAAGGDFGIRAAQQATATIPILGFTDDMIGSRLVDSLARPGGNTTGISLLATELDGKRQEILIEAVPGLRRMAAFRPMPTLPRSGSSKRYRTPRAHAGLNCRFIGSPKPMKSRQQSIPRRLRMPPHSTYWRRLSSSPIAR
jgi:putative ABC transport system substrate-binding protein